MLVATISFRAQPHKSAELLSAVAEAVSRMRRTAGCGRCRLLQQVEHPHEFVLASEWVSTAEASAFLQAREFRVFRSVLTLMREPPIVEFDHIEARVTRVVPR